MKMLKTGVIGAILFVTLFAVGGAQAAVTCSNANLAGRWSISVIDPSSAAYCPRVVIGRTGAILAKKSAACTIFEDVGPNGSAETFKLTGGRLQLNSDCSMKPGTIKATFGNASIKFGRMNKDKGSMTFHSVDSDGWMTKFDAIKAP